MAKKRVQVEGVSAPALKNSIGGLGQTFVSPETNPRGAQIANALSSVIAPAVQQKVDEYQEDVRYVDGLKAKNQFALLEAPLLETAANADMSIKEQADGTFRRQTQEEVFASWANAGEYQAALDSLGSRTAKRALEQSVSQTLAQGYGKAAVVYDQEELRQTLSQSLQVGLSQGQLPAADVWANYDASLVNTNLMDRQEAMEQLLLSAEKTLRDTGSTSGFDYIESRGMGNDKWKMMAEDIKERALNDVAIKNERDRKNLLSARTDKKVDLLSQSSLRLLENPNADLDDLEAEALENGIYNFRNLTEGLRADYGKQTGEFKMGLNDRVELYKQLSSLPTKEGQLQFLIDNSSTIDRATQGTWLGFINSGSLPDFRDEKEYIAVKGTLDKELEFGGAKENSFQVQGHLDDLFYQIVQTEKWKNAEPLERMSIARDVVKAAKELAGVGVKQGVNQPLTFKREEAAAKEVKTDVDKAEQDRMDKVLEDLEKQYNDTK
jgi:hypothetical protein